LAALLGVAILFLILAFAAYLMGAKGIAGLSMSVARVLIVVFVLLFMATFVLGNTSNL
jgi:uncharacterized membrane protein YtjA (UPF0391 family)